jgi:sugar O-acyltransferase (sialic acid O-acetyltransferase NeuD family)
MSEKKVFVVGSSGHASVVIDTIERQGLFDIVGLLDYRFPNVRDHLLGYPILGKEEDLPTLSRELGTRSLIIGVGENQDRENVAAKIDRILPERTYVSAIHPSASIARNVLIGDGTVIVAGVVVGPHCQIGRHCVLNTNSSLDHDGTMSDYSCLCPRVVTAGGCHIGHQAAIGIGAVLGDKVQVGSYAFVGAGAVVLRDVAPYAVTFGSPSRQVRSRDPAERFFS